MSKDPRNIFEVIDTTVAYIRTGQEGFTGMSLIQTFNKLADIAESLPKEKFEQLVPILNVMHDAQQRQDMIYIADILQYEIVNIIKK